MKAAMLSRAVLAALLVASTSALAAPPGQVLHPPAHIEACAPCHGVDGIARDVEVPHLAGQNVVYLYNQLRAFRSGQRKHKEMNYMSRSLTAGEMESLADYFASLPRQ
jgi:cytochrome c553